MLVFCHTSFLDLKHIGFGHSFSKVILEAGSSGPYLPSRAKSYGVLPSMSMSSKISSLLKATVGILLFALLLPES